MDGSAEPFLFLIECAGVKAQETPRRVVRVDKAVTVDRGKGFASLVPGAGFTVSFEIDFDNPTVARQQVTVSLVNGTFGKELARARTFGFLSEVEQMRAAGLARGGSLDNAVVVSGDGVLNEGGLRFDDEFVRHKALDAVGDLYLAGAPLIGHFSGHCSGHDINSRLLRALFADETVWSLDVLRAEDMEVSAPAPWTDETAGAIAAIA
jgi:UDP-3-O-[3-hydroxymyristoyl] N-acetylglucosamine deacetylase